MCGLIVAWDPAGLADAPLAAALADLHHRGPDAQAILWREDHRLQLAHARLKVIDTTDGANQPFVSPCGRWAIVYNGEIYNYQELRGEIGDRWPWRTRSDTEVLMAAWSLWGVECLHKLVGMFAFALHDAQLNMLTLVRDRFGIKPLYRVQAGEAKFFASEIPPLLRFLPTVQPDNSTILTYLESGLYDHSQKTFFDGVSAVEPGSMVEIDLRTGGEQLRRWYRLIDHVPDLSAASESELMERTEGLIMQAVQSNLVADVAVGLNVSGGVDSSMLVRATIEKLGHAHLFTQDYAGYSELPWVREVAEGGTLHVAELSLERINEYLSATVKAQAEPFGGVTVCGYNAVYEMAANQGVTVLLDGNGVDEVFLGYKKYHQIYVASLLTTSERDLAISDFREFWGEKPKAVPPGASIDGTDGLCPEAIAPALRSHGVYSTSPLDGFEVASPVRRAAAKDLLRTKIPRGLRFNDRVSMAHSRELRVPFLDHRLVEFGFGIPERYLFGRQGTKLLFRKILAKRAPPTIAFAAKRSVQSPQREWLGGGWRNMVEEVLMSRSFSARGWVNPAVAKDAYQRYLSGNQENSFFIWQWINLELWARAYLDGTAQ